MQASMVSILYSIHTHNPLQTIIRDKFATIVPLIIATDRTQLSIMCGGQQAYPVYVTIAVDDFPDVTDTEERSRLKHQLIHDAMAVLMEPLKQAAKEGVIMTCADGRQRRVYPIPAAFEGDWPEQCGMASAEEGGCPVCEQAYSQRAEYPNLAPLRKPSDTLTALRAYFRQKDPGELKALRLKPWWPWWSSIPHTNFHAAIMPDLLHQLYQGMIKSHAVAWSKQVIKPDIVDKCFRSMPGAVGRLLLARRDSPARGEPSPTSYR